MYYRTQENMCMTFFLFNKRQCLRNETKAEKILASRSTCVCGGCELCDVWLGLVESVLIML